MTTPKLGDAVAYARDMAYAALYGSDVRVRQRNAK